jgi:L-seryl-tRNA(Ser) seleniumtransferase
MKLSGLPSVEQLLQTQLAAELIASFGRPLTLQAIRQSLEDIRQKAARAEEVTLPGREGLLEQASLRLQDWTTPGLVSVINATGVILHTNLGRAPLCTSSIAAMEAASRGYANLEMDLHTGKRGSRMVSVEKQLRQLTGAEAAVVVNNNAAGILLVLAALAYRKRVIIPRSQLVEIGGGFRVPDVMKQSGAKLVEVGATNKVRLADFEEALAEPAALVMRAHRSNFKMIGFTEEPEWKDIVALAHARGISCVDDLGSGALLPTEKYGLGHEPTVQESLQAGTDLVCFSGDKLLGGPQAGIILGRAGLIEKICRHPLARALRADKLCLAGLEATLLHYLKDDAEYKIPVWRMIALKPEQVRHTADRWAKEIGQGETVPCESTVGGGSLPGETMPGFGLSLAVKSPEKFMEKLRRQQPPIIARTENDHILLDPRTVLPEQEGALLVGLMNALGEKTNPAKISGLKQ